jgi:hypothetical protein
MPDAATIAAAFPSCPECGTKLVRELSTGWKTGPVETMCWRCPNLKVKHHDRVKRYAVVGELLGELVAA